jgi:hypothetical protein
LALTRILLADEEDLSWLLDLDPAFGLLDLPKNNNRNSIKKCNLMLSA